MEELYQYFPSFFPDHFDDLYEQVSEKCKRFPISMYGKTFMSKRRSCVFADSSDLHDYSIIKTYDWEECGLIQDIRAKVEDLLGVDFDYVLVHIYQDGTDYIGYHNDKEALNTTIASVSFGSSRKFRLRRIGETKGWEKEYTLSSGDLFVMYGPSDISLGCQNVYKHSVPVEKRVKGPRINLTFRESEK